MIPIPEIARFVLERLNCQYEAVLVGGAVRDSLLGLDPQDVDIATSATPEEVRQCFMDFPILETGAKHGTLTVLIDHRPVEITTYRTEKKYLDRRHPSEIAFTRDLNEDLSRRDFTVNALCVTLDQTLIDRYHGLDDLHHRTLRAIGEPTQRFEEDALRILRALRFSAQLDFTIEENTRKALFACRNHLNEIAIERIVKEGMGILAAPHAAAILAEYYPIFAVFLPEIGQLAAKPAVFQRILDRLARCPESLALRLACVFAEVGCLRAENSSAMISTVAFLDIAKRLKLPNALVGRVAFLLQNQAVILQADRIELKKRLARWNDSFFELLRWLELLDDQPESFKEIKTMLQEILKDNPCLSLKQLQINGEDAIHAGYQGAEIRHALERCLMQVIEEKLPNEREALLTYLQQGR